MIGKSIPILVVLTLLLIIESFAQISTKDNTVMKRYLVEQSFPKSLNIPMNDKGYLIVQSVVSNNTDCKV